MKRILALLLVAMLVMGTLSGCKKNNTDNKGEVTQTPTPTQEVQPTAVPDEILTAQQAYAKFVEGELTVEITTGYADLDPSVEYTIGDLGNFISSEYLSYRLLPQKLNGISYSIFDSAEDGAPELAVKYNYIDENYGLIPMDEIVIFGYENNKMKFLTSLRSDGTRNATINTRGLIDRNEVVDEHLIKVRYSYLAPDGTEKPLYAIELMTGVELPIIPGNYLPSDLQRLGSDQGEEGGELTLSVYNFSAEEEGSDAYLKQNYFVFSDADSNDLPADGSYAEEYAKAGLTVTTMPEVTALVNECLAKEGITEEIKNASRVNWTTASEKAYAEIRSGIDTQIILIANNRDKWFNNTLGDDTFYAVTDLNMDGHLELIRTSMKYNPEETRNRFWQVSPDYRTLEPMEYEGQFTLADGTEDTHQPTLMSVEEIRSYWNFSYTDYYYVFPSRFNDEDGETMSRMILNINSDGKVLYSGNLGEQRFSFKDVSTTYFDTNGETCTEERFNDLAGDYFKFDERTWIKEVVRIAFVTITDTNDLQNLVNMLYNSYTLISRETLE